MNGAKPITILGGGLAGLTLGLALRERSVPTTIFEAGSYPRHRVCGEFLSGRGQSVLGELGLLAAFQAAGARSAHTAAFATANRLGPVWRLPQPALCLSRFALDDLLAHEFACRGGELRTGERRPIELTQEGVICATGRTPQAHVDGWRWFGVKAHARRVNLVADLELHVSPGAYVGLCRLSDDCVNVCGLFRRRVHGSETRLESPLEGLRGPAGSLRFQRLVSAKFLPETVCTVAGLDLRPRRATPQPGIRLGDALTMIPPFTGNGMSLALESAALAAEPVAAFGNGETTWESARQLYTQACDDRFRARLRWAAVLQRLLFMPLAPGLILRWTAQHDLIWRHLFAATRGIRPNP